MCLFSFLMNIKLTEPKVIDLTLVFPVERDTWCLCSPSKHAYSISFSILVQSSLVYFILSYSILYPILSYSIYI